MSDALDNATDVGSIVGYLKLNIRDWLTNADVAEAKAHDIGRLDPRVHIDSNAATTVAELEAVEAASNQVDRSTKRVSRSADEARKPILSLWSSAALLAPTLAPIGAVGVAAMTGLGLAAAAAALGVAGVVEQYKAGELQGTEFGRSIAGIVSEWQTLKDVAAGGLMPGAETTLQRLHQLWPMVNQDTAYMARTVGNLASGAAPALVQVLDRLNPLLMVIGTQLERGAQGLEQWSRSSDGVSRFVGYTQQALPAVTGLLKEVTVTVAHLAAAGGDTGIAIVSDLGALLHVLNALPVGVLRTLIPLLITGRAAMAAYRGVNAIVDGVSNSWASAGDRIASVQTTLAARSAASAAAEQAAAADAASAQATKARAAADAALTQAAASEQVSAAAGAESLEVALAADAEATALEARAAVAVESAATMEAASAEAAAAAKTAGVAAATSWAAVLGPIGAVATGILLLTTMMDHNTDAAQADARAMSDYAQSVRESTDALSAANIAQTQQLLASSGALGTLHQLEQQNRGLTLSYQDVVDAVNGSAAQYRAAKIELQQVADEGRRTGGSMSAMAILADGLTKKITDLRDGLHGQISQQQALNQAMEQAQGITDTQARSAAALYGLVGQDGVNSYLQAQQAAAKNTDQTKQQTLAFQLENNAAGLVNQALQTMAGQNLSAAQAQTAVDSATLAVTQSLKQNGSTIADNTQKGVANRQAIEGAASALRSKLQADAEATGSTEKATASYRTSAKVLLDQIKRTDGANSAVYRYAQRLLQVPPVAKTKVELEAEQARRDWQRFIATVHDITVTATVRANLASTYASQVPGHATGTQSWRGGLTWVGEQGKELVQLPAGAKIYTTSQSQHMQAVAAQQSATPKQEHAAAQRDVTVTQHITMTEADPNQVGAAAAFWLGTLRI